jgi:hypothetical protein
MKAGWQIAVLAVLAGGCATQSRFQNDPRAAIVGPDYLVYIEQYPRDRDTQYYYPAFTIGALLNWVDPSPRTQNAGADEIQRLLTIIPPIPSSVQQIQGKGWSELEREGMPLFLPKQE